MLKPEGAGGPTTLGGGGIVKASGTTSEMSGVATVVTCNTTQYTSILYIYNKVNSNTCTKSVAKISIAITSVGGAGAAGATRKSVPGRNVAGCESTLRVEVDVTLGDSRGFLAVKIVIYSNIIKKILYKISKYFLMIN